MKKNVFSRAIAVLASMTVLGAASMLSASAAPGLMVGTVEIEAGSGETSVEIPLYMVDVESAGVTMQIKADSALTLGKAVGGIYAQEITGDGNLAGVWGDGEPFSTDEPFSVIKVTFDADIAPGTYPIEVASFTEFDDGSDDVLDDEGNVISSGLTDPTFIAGGLVVKAAETEPEATAAPTTAAPTTAAATTTTKKSASPKTGSTGVAVAVAGLVTAGATAVVLKKKH